VTAIAKKLWRLDIKADEYRLVVQSYSSLCEATRARPDFVRIGGARSAPLRYAGGLPFHILPHPTAAALKTVNSTQREAIQCDEFDMRLQQV
jgi:hypothetical protein